MLVPKGCTWQRCTLPQERRPGGGARHQLASPRVSWASHTGCQRQSSSSATASAQHPLTSWSRSWNPSSLSRTKSKRSIPCSYKPTSCRCGWSWHCTLFAGGNPLDLKLIYCMSGQYIVRCVWAVVDAINVCLDNIHFPIDVLTSRDSQRASRGAASGKGPA